MAVRRRSGEDGRALWRRVAGGVESWPAGVTTLSGDDRFHLARAWRALSEGLAPGDAEMAVSVMRGEGGKIDVARVVAEARALGMFSPVRVVLVPEATDLEGEPEPLIEYAKHPPEGSFLLIRAPELDKRRKLHKAIASAGRRLEFQPPGSHDGRGWMRWASELAAERGLELAHEAAGFLVAVAEGDVQRLDAELAKLDAFRAGATGPVGLDEVRRLAVGSGAMSGWEVADAVLDRDPARALADLRRLLDRGEEPIRLLGGLASRARAMLQAAGMQAAGAPRKEIVDRVRAWYFRDRLFDGLGRYDSHELMRFPGLLLEADRTLKSRSIPAGAVLETLVERMIAGR